MTLMKHLRWLRNVLNKPLWKIVAVLIVLFTLFSIPIFAQSLWFQPSSAEHDLALQECADGNVGLECTVTAIVNAILNTTSTSTFRTTEHPTADPTPFSYRRPGAVQFAGGFIAGLIAERPVSSGQYIQYVARKINPVEPAYAQSTGYRALLPLTDLWAAFRNIAYLAYVIIFIFIGFMIMFRAQLDPQTVVNLQNSLPKLVVTLLLITFSFAIAGFFVDLIYLGIYLVISTLYTQGLLTSASAPRQVFIGENIFTILFKGFDTVSGDTAGDQIRNIIENVFDNDTIGFIVGIVGDAFVTVIMSVALLFAAFRLFFQLLMSYVKIIMLTIFSPLMILPNALPGSDSFSSWARNFLANVLVFPAAAALLLIGAILMGPCTSSDPDRCSLGRDEWGITSSVIRDSGEGWLPPFIGFTTDVESVLALIGYGFILFTPQLVTTLQQALKAKGIPAAGIFAPIAAGARVATAPVRGVAGGISSGARTYVAQKIESLAGETRRK